ncbi:MAG TPA: 5'-3' exonuclease H3TH domain-containing protein [Anaeromyxobacter sp.]|nr:5'-3' exonuclease H3TH domain-containing protein [Anaeromyxobacter sp.]
MNVHLVDGTYELFRAYFGAPPAKGPDGREVGATRGLVRSLALLLREEGVSHVAVAFDHVIESFRNELFPGYKTSAGVPADLLDQFQLAEDAVRALGVVVWSMVEFEADDAMATAAARFAGRPGVERILLCTPDKDLAQCVRGRTVVGLDRLRKRLLDEDGVREKFGVAPASIPDWLALVGDTADGIPGLPRWGEKSAAAVLARYGRLEEIPDLHHRWGVPVRGALALAESLRTHRAEALLYRTLATLREDVPLAEDLEALRWRGPDRERLAALEAAIGEKGIGERLPRGRG